MEIKGPGKFDKNGNYKQYAAEPTFEAYLTLKKRTYMLLSNNIKISLKESDKIFIYHMYKYKVDNEVNQGRWYNTQFNKSEFKNMKNNTLIVKIKNYEDENTGEKRTAVFKFVFNDKIKKRIINFLG